MEKVSIIDPLDDPNTINDPFFNEADSCLVIQKPNCLLRVRDQGKTDVCYAFVVTACMFGDEVNSRGHSIELSTQEYLDYIHKYQRPKSIMPDTGPFEVLPCGFFNSYRTTFRYAMEHGVSPNSLYPWVGKCKFDTCDGGLWDGKVEDQQAQIITREQKTFIQHYKNIVGRKAIEDQLKIQPTTGHIRVTEALKRWRSSDVYKARDATGDAQEWHAITIVGYGGQGLESYYVCQNSYGLDWGYKGYFKASRDLVDKTFIPVGTYSPQLM